MERIRELIEQLRLHLQLQIAIADVLEEHNKRLKDLEGYKLKNDAAVTAVRKQCDKLGLTLQTVNKELHGRVIR